MPQDIENKDNYYVLPEDENERERRQYSSSNNLPDEYELPEDDDPEEGEVYADDDDIEDDDDIDIDELFPPGDEEPEGEKGKSPFVAMLRTMISPVEGWKSIRRHKISPEHFASGCFYPLTALASVSAFASLIYGSTTPISELIIDALRIFLSFFLGYFAVLLLGKIFMPSGKRIFDSSFGKVFVMDSLSTLALFFTFYMVFPMVEPVLVFLPLWTFYSISRGVRFLKIPQSKSILATCVMSVLTVGLPMGVYMLLGFILPVTQ